MPTPSHLAAPEAQDTDRARRLLRRAWWSLLLVPVAFVAAVVLGEWLLSLQGHGSGGEETVPLGAALAAGLPAVLILLAPAGSAIWCGLRARREGLRAGIYPAVIGIVYAAFAVLTNTLPLLLGAGWLRTG
jgi:hypothetical protein